MKCLKIIIIILSFSLAATLSFAQQEVDLEDIKRQLASEEGLGGSIHGAVSDQSVFVFTWRSRENFFVNIQLPMYTQDPVIAEQLKSLSRHDYLVIKGEYFDNKAPIKHINVDEIISLTPWDGPNGEYDYSIPPQEILNSVEATVKVHATANEGSVLVVEYQDRVFPVFNKDQELVAPLFRNDIIRIKYLAQAKEGRPIHLAINSFVDDPLVVLNRIEEGHGEEIELTGDLVMFPQSPQIKFNVFALRTEDENGLRRNYTLVNFEDFDLFEQIRNTIERVWLSQEATAVYDRNKFINRRVKITAKGIKNVVSKNQANPQIILNSIQDITFNFEN